MRTEFINIHQETDVPSKQLRNRQQHHQLPKPIIQMKLSRLNDKGPYLLFVERCIEEHTST